MKRKILKQELEQIDAVGVVADHLRQSRGALQLALVRLLEVDDWDRDAIGHIADYVTNPGSTEFLLERLGVEVIEIPF